MDSFLKDPGSDTLSRLCRPISFLTPDLITAPPSWLGHTPFALWSIEALRPQTFVELGTHTGNSYSAFCQAVKQLGTGTACYAVDTWQGDPQAGYYGDEVYRRLADFHDLRYGAFSRMLRMTFDEAAGHFSPGSVDLLHIDGLHTYDAVRHDFETWLPKMSPRGVVLFHDSNVRKDDFGVWKLWDELSAAYPSFGFLHSNGLGVLGVGGELPEAAQWLFDARGGEREHEIRAFFDRLGSGVIETQQAQARADHILALQGEIAGLHEAVRGKVDEIRSVMTTVAERDRDIAILQGGVASRDQIILDLQAVQRDREQAIAARDRDILILQGEIEALRGANAEQDAVIRNRDERLRGLYSSTSWKVSAPVRKLGRLVQSLRRYHRSRRHRMALEPMHDVVVQGRGFESTGVDPALRLVSDQGRCPTGWCVVSYRVADSSVPLSPLLYVDCGAGFGEGGIIRLPPLLEGSAETLVLLPNDAKALRLDPTDRPASFVIEELTIHEIGKVQVLQRALQQYRGQTGRGLDYLRRHGWGAAKARLLHGLLPSNVTADYDTWVGLYDTLTPADRQAIAASIARMPQRPMISVVMPVYNTPEPYLRRAIDTVLEQLYPDWELCIADDASTAPHVARVLEEYAGRDARIKWVRRETNGHISAASNTALELATGTFVALMDHDDELPPHALYVVAEEIVRHPDADVIYSDEDKIDENGRRYDPYFKSDWNPDLFCGQNMVSHLGVFRRTLLEAIGGFRVGYEGSQDYDLVLRAVEKTDRTRIRHIPMILYHWRVFSASSSFSTVALPTATDAARRALQDHFDRIGVPARVGAAPGAEWYSRITYPMPDPAPLVSLIVPTRDKLDLLRQCVEGLLGETDYPNLEVLILDNNSEEAETLAYFASLEGRERVKVLRYEGPFNFSAINNYGVQHARGELIGLINNDIKVIEPGWLKEMVSHAVRPEVGAVGAKLYYGDDTIQHAGVVTGINGVANHIHKNLPREHPGHFGRLRLVQNMSCVTAACLIMRRAVFDEVDGLDEENLAVAFNDVDLCLRIREKGYFLVWTPHAELYHLESASRGSDMAPDKIARFMREIRYMHGRWGKALIEDPFYNPNLTLEAADFGLAFPPRVVRPWLQKESA
ncbi:glycosyltransferase [Azospirillum sp.]|uniref:glycosyltransferase n=1 Tax=Azospirillum sp. TaxID=34012 RepID=UPI003D74202B